MAGLGVWSSSCRARIGAPRRVAHASWARRESRMSRGRVAAAVRGGAREWRSGQPGVGVGDPGWGKLGAEEETRERGEGLRGRIESKLGF